MARADLVLTTPQAVDSPVQLPVTLTLATSPMCPS
jgi:hypothetical protein